MPILLKLLQKIREENISKLIFEASIVLKPKSEKDTTRKEKLQYCAAVHGFMKSQTWLGEWKATMNIGENFHNKTVFYSTVVES